MATVSWMILTTTQISILQWELKINKTKDIDIYLYYITVLNFRIRYSLMAEKYRTCHRTIF